MTTKRSKFFALPVLAFLALLSFPNAARAEFEIKETTVEKGEVELEYKGDYHSGNPNRKFGIDGGEIVADENDIVRQSHSFELGFGLTNFLKLSVGAEAEEERFDDVDGVALVNTFDSLKFTALEANATLALVKPTANGFSLAAYASIEHAFESSEGEIARIGPLLSVAQGRWSATASFLFAKHFGGNDPEENSDDRWDFEYAAQVAYEMNDRLTLAVESYGLVKRLGSSGSPGDGALAFGDQDHYRLGPVAYYTFKRSAHESHAMKLGNSDDDEEGEDDGGGVTMNLGVLLGLNDDTPGTTLKWGLSAGF
jgi:hypothetical protein